MTTAAARFCLLCFALAGGGLTQAQTLTTGELQKLLQSVSLVAMPFQEQHQSPWLATPVESRGTVRALPQGLEKQIDFPRKETWHLLPDRLEWTGANGVATRRILFSKSPAVAVLSDAIRRVVTGDLLSLERDFEITVQGDAKQWKARLQPHGTEVARYLDHLELEGTGARLLVLVVVERKGERTTTQFGP